MVSKEGKWSQRRANGLKGGRMVSDAMLPLIRVTIWFQSKSSLYYYSYSEKNKEKGGSYRYSNRTC